MSRLSVVSAFLLAAVAAGAVHAADLSLSEATRRVLDRNPQTALSAALVDAADGRLTQAGVLPNPEVSYLGNSSKSPGSTAATYTLSQRFSLPGKRSARQAFAGEDRALTVLEAQAERLRLTRLTRETYIDALAGQERQVVAEQNLMLVQQLRDAVSARVEAGKVSPIELSRANVALAGARRASQQAVRQGELSRKQLAGLWGETTLNERLSDDLDIPAQFSPAGGADAAPVILQAQKRIQRGQAAVRLAEAQRLPDFTLSAGTEREAVTRDQNMLFGVSVPIPLFDRNQGALRSARAELTAAEASLSLTQLQFQRERDQLLTLRDGNYQDALQLRDEVLKTAREALEATREGYRAGKFSLIDLLDAQRSLIDAQAAYLAARTSLHKSDAALDELLGRMNTTGITP